MLVAIIEKVAVIGLLFFSLTCPGQKVFIKPKPDWVKEIKPDLSAVPNGEAVAGFYYLLLDRQDNVKSEERFGHFAYRIMTNEGIQEMADLFLNFDPSYQSLTLHQLVVYRNDKVIDQLDFSNIKTIQREESMDRYLYDGSLTAVINLKDIRVGDVIEYAYTYKGYNPVFEHHFMKRIDFNFGLPYHKLYSRVILPFTTNVKLKYGNGAPRPRQQTIGNNVEYHWELDEVDALITDSSTPSWYDPFQYVVMSDFQNWSEVVSWALVHFEVSENERNELKREMLNQFNAQQNGEELIKEIIHFVQDDIRYLGFESGLNGYKPHTPLKIFAQRFGDCKDKSLLLVTLLQLNGIKAFPMLVNTRMRDKLEETLPAADEFDHCVVAIEYNGKNIYVDPTINNQGGTLSSNYFPAYGRGLIIRYGEDKLTVLPQAGISSIQEEQNFMLESVGGEATLLIQTTYQGMEADSQRSFFAANSLESVQKTYLNYNANLYPDIVSDGKIETLDDREKNIFIVTEKYRIPNFWTVDENVSGQVNGEFYPLGLETYTNVSNLSQRSAPQYLNYPVSYKSQINVSLPEVWSINSTEKNIDGPGYHYQHKVSYTNKQLTLEHHYQTFKDHVKIDDVPKFIEDHKAIRLNLDYIIMYNKSLAGGFRLSWISVMLSLFVLGLASFGGHILYNRYNPPLERNAGSGQPIGGWLLLVGLGLIITPFRIIYDLVISNQYFDQVMWETLIYQENWGLFSLVGVEFVYNICYLIFCLVVIALFLNRRSSLPRVISIYYGINFLVTVVDTLAAFGVGIEYDAAQQNEIYRDIFKSLMAAMIWIPYFNLSERVKTTFVERIENDPEPDPEKTLTFTMKG